MKALIFVFLVSVTLIACDKEPENTCGICTAISVKTPPVGSDVTAQTEFEACTEAFEFWNGKQTTKMIGDTSVVTNVTCQYY